MLYPDILLQTAPMRLTDHDISADTIKLVWCIVSHDFLGPHAARICLATNIPIFILTLHISIMRDNLIYGDDETYQLSVPAQ